MRTSSQVLTLKVGLVQASRAVHRRLLSAADAKASQLGLFVPADCDTTEELASDTDPKSRKKSYIYIVHFA